MPGGSRSLPGRPSLRHLKLEAKRRLAAGEFPTLHDAQVAIAREYGLPTWAALKQRINEQAEQESHALDQLRWVIARFSGAEEPDWPAPDDDELGQHFSERFLAAIPPARLVEAIARMAADLRGEMEVIRQAPLQAQVRLGGLEYIAAVEAEPPYRLTGLRGLPLGRRVRDPRVADPAPARTWGEVPAEAPAIAAAAQADLGLVALLLAGGDQKTPQEWVLAQGWADLDRGEALDPGHRFPAPGVTALVTTTAVLRLVADGRIRLDDPANGHLRAVRLADDTITVRELLSHTAGVDNPAPDRLYGETAQDLATVMGPVIGCTGPRGVAEASNGGIVVLGQLVTDVTGQPYADAATRLVLEPLQLSDSSFPARVTDIPDGAVTGYNLTLEGMFRPFPPRVPTLAAVAGLWSTGADLVRLGLGWSALLPGSLAHEALTPQAPQTGLGWLLSPDGEVAMIAGGGHDAVAYLGVRIRDGRTHVVLTSRMMPVNTIAERLLRT